MLKGKICDENEREKQRSLPLVVFHGYDRRFFISDSQFFVEP